MLRGAGRNFHGRVLKQLRSIKYAPNGKDFLAPTARSRWQRLLGADPARAGWQHYDAIKPCPSTTRSPSIKCQSYLGYFRRDMYQPSAAPFLRDPITVPRRELIE